jgi:hypothetical protein
MLRSFFLFLSVPVLAFGLADGPTECGSISFEPTRDGQLVLTPLTKLEKPRPARLTLNQDGKREEVTFSSDHGTSVFTEYVFQNLHACYARGVKGRVRVYSVSPTTRTFIKEYACTCAGDEP